MVEIKKEIKNDYYLTNTGRLLRRKYIAKRNEVVWKEIQSGHTPTGMKKINIDNSSYGLALLVYKTFKDENVGNQQIVFLDGDRDNCSLENLITLDNLVNFYNTMQEVIKRCDK